MLFKDIKLITPIQKALIKSGYEIATPIQEKSIPKILEGKDLFGIAQTGTGKTAAFTLPILQLMHKKCEEPSKLPRTLILAPTRELAAQIGEAIENYGSFTRFRHTVIFGGVKQFSQEKALRRGVDIIIATPGRLLDLMNQKLVDLSKIDFFILDEADRMLDMGFINDIKKIVNKLSLKRQTLFFSATMSKQIGDLAKQFLINPFRVEIKPQSTTVEKIEQGIYFVDTISKDRLLLNILKSNKISSAIVFTRTKHKSNRIATFLSKNGVEAEAIHGNKSQNQRVKTLNDFKLGKLKVLVATEIVARGIDIDNISHVINYELPNEPESYVHRIGRTARAGSSGIAYSFCCADERDYLREIEKLIKKEITIIKHDKHSNFAQNATGKDAKPLPKGQQRGRSNAFTSKKENSNSKFSKNKNKKFENSSNKTKSKFRSSDKSRNNFKSKNKDNSNKKEYTKKNKTFNNKKVKY